MTKIEQIQKVLGVKVDNLWGPRSQAALDAEIAGGGGNIHVVKASSFADPADVRAFKRCKAQGKTDQQCFKVGDNGIGKWGDDTTANRPMCALPRDDWQAFGAAARGKKVLVVGNGKSVVCELRDTMPWKKNIKNGAGIDLNPAACAALGKKPPMMIPATWKWV